MKRSRTVAVIDTGTNSTRLLIARVADGLEELERRTEITRLGEGVDVSGKLQDDARGRVEACVDGYASLIGRHAVTEVLIIATSSVRDASNGADFISSLARSHSFAYRVLDGETEARLAFSGALVDEPRSGRVMLFDIGGGSTEVVVGEEGRVILARSHQLGCVRVSERFLKHDPPLAGEVAAARSHVAGELTQSIAAATAAEPEKVIAVAGTMTTLAALDLGLEVYSRAAVHGHQLSADAIEGLLVKLASMDAAQRAAIRIIEPGRADVIVAGALIASTLMELGRFPQVTISENDILDGVAMALVSGEI